ncbi:hypothetical protein E4U41_004340 [Claviceps citrina]|nr:hypothetical protein E4U41_004340 [Claviceps citrina]
MESTSPTVHNAAGAPLSTGNAVLTSTASMTQVSEPKEIFIVFLKSAWLGLTSAQDFEPMKNICAHINGFHAYADDTGRSVEANHYCSHLNDDVRQCLIYDSADRNARLIGIEYMIAPHLYDSLPQEERRLWHSHVYEVKSGMLVMPNRMVPDAAWDAAETQEMKEVITLYGKTYHFWQTDRGDKLPLGEPKLMASYTADGQLDFGALDRRDEKFGVSYKKKKANRESIESPKIHPDADSAWSPKR